MGVNGLRVAVWVPPGRLPPQAVPGVGGGVAVLLSAALGVSPQGPWGPATHGCAGGGVGAPGKGGGLLRPRLHSRFRGNGSVL